MRCPICMNYVHQCGVTRKCEPYEQWEGRYRPEPPKPEPRKRGGR